MRLSISYIGQSTMSTNRSEENMKFVYEINTEDVSMSFSFDGVNENTSIETLNSCWILPLKSMILTTIGGHSSKTLLSEKMLTSRAVNALKKRNIKTIGELCNLSEKEISGIDSIGNKTKEEIMRFISGVKINASK